MACFIFVEYTFNVAITAQGFSQYVAPLASVHYSDLVLQLPKGWTLDLMAVGMTCVFGIINLAGTQVGSKEFVIQTTAKQQGFSPPLR